MKEFLIFFAVGMFGVGLIKITYALILKFRKRKER